MAFTRDAVGQTKGRKVGWFEAGTGYSPHIGAVFSHGRRNRSLSRRFHKYALWDTAGFAGGHQAGNASQMRGTGLERNRGRWVWPRFVLPQGWPNVQNLFRVFRRMDLQLRPTAIHAHSPISKRQAGGHSTWRIRLLMHIKAEPLEPSRIPPTIGLLFPRSDKNG
jgi:hypothetical protein